MKSCLRVGAVLNWTWVTLRPQKESIPAIQSDGTDCLFMVPDKMCQVLFIFIGYFLDALPADDARCTVFLCFQVSYRLQSALITGYLGIL